ncbi:MAG: hypothetical protein IJ710_08155 [Prevotella sp.]|nr:hypothetical protein [Prevotella sp.]
MPNVIDIIKEKSGIEDTSLEGLAEAAQQKLDDGTVDETLEKLGVKDTSRIKSILKGLLGIFGVFRGLVGGKAAEKEEEEEEEVEEEEEEIEEEEEEIEEEEEEEEIEEEEE